MYGPVRQPSAPFETGPIPLLSEAFFVVSCPYLHMIEPGWQLAGYISSDTDVRLLFSSIDASLCLYQFSLARILNRNPHLVLANPRFG
jgi:hypothetical protein